MAKYKLTYNDQIISMPSENVGVSYTPPVLQYEKVLYTSPNGLGKTTGNISEPLSNFDEVIIGVRWQSDPNIFNTEYYRYRTWTGTGTIVIKNEIMSTNTWFIIMQTLTINNDDLTWNIVKPANCNWFISNRTDQNVKWGVGGSTSTYGMVSEIIGVKYQ